MTQLNTNISDLLSALRSSPDLPVIFTLNHHTIHPGYHITEVKSSVVHSLDCGAGEDQWRELVIELLDGSSAALTEHMSSRKMLGILEKALDTMQNDDSTKLYFEFSPENAALLKSSVSTMQRVDSTLIIALKPITAQCKPFQRAIQNGIASSNGNGCCASAPTKSGNDDNQSGSTSSCC